LDWIACIPSTVNLKVGVAGKETVIKQRAKGTIIDCAKKQKTKKTTNKKESGNKRTWDIPSHSSPGLVYGLHNSVRTWR
jgi:hypothetical protein